MMFILFCCVLTLMLVAALTFLLKPLVLVESGLFFSRVPIFLAISFALLASILYLTLGAPIRLLEYYRSEALARVVTPELSQTPSLERLAKQLQQRVTIAPDSGKGWYWLARVEIARQNFDAALFALARARTLLGDSPDINFQCAQALYFLHGEVFDKEITTLLQQVIAAEPQHEGALLLLAEAAFNQQDYTAAIQYWRRLLVQHDGNTSGGKALLAAIARAQALATQASVQPHFALPVVVALNKPFSGQLPPRAAVFIFVKNADTQARMPLLVVRKQVKDLPIHMVLTEINAMTPGIDWSKIHTVLVSARLSLSGSALKNAEDIQGNTVLIKVGTMKKPVIISLNQKT
jgi:cytochrome c-type biogenesis protein CcmH